MNVSSARTGIVASSTSRQWLTAVTNPSCARVLKKIVPMPATPTAPASCCIAFRTPDADPTSLSATDARMKSNSGETIIPIPIPTSSSGATIANEVVSRPWARITCRSHHTPPAAMTAAI